MAARRLVWKPLSHREFDVFAYFNTWRVFVFLRIFCQNTAYFCAAIPFSHQQPQSDVFLAYFTLHNVSKYARIFSVVCMHKFCVKIRGRPPGIKLSQSRRPQHFVKTTYFYTQNVLKYSRIFSVVSMHKFRVEIRGRPTGHQAVPITSATTLCIVSYFLGKIRNITYFKHQMCKKIRTIYVTYFLCEVRHNTAYFNHPISTKIRSII
jgi:hypothetical protein